MSVEKTDTHPTAISDAEKAEMAKMLAEEEAELGAAGADDETGDDLEATAAADAVPDKGAQAAGAGAAAPAKDKVDGAPPAAAAAATAAGADADAGAGTDAADAGAGTEPAPGTVQRKQYDGVLAELRETRATVQTLKAALTNPRTALPERDFDAEDQALDAKEAALDDRYEKEGLADEEYRASQRELQRERRALDRERNKYELHAQLEQDRIANEALAAEQAKASAEKAWADSVASWEESKGDWLKNPVRRATVSQTMEMMNADPELSKLDNAGYLAKLEEFLADAFPNFPTTAPAATDTTTVDPRRKLAAARAAEVGAAPPRIEGGVGNRGTGTQDIDLEAMPHASHTKGGAVISKFGLIPESKQNEMLGIE